MMLDTTDIASSYDGCGAPSSFTRLKLGVVGVSAEHICRLASEEALLADMFFWQLASTATLNFCLLLLGLGGQGAGPIWWIASALGAALVAIVIAGIDRRSIIGGWVETGTAMLVREGLFREPRGACLARAVAIIVRLGLSFSVSSVIATLCIISLLRRDIDTDKANQSRSLNAAPYVAATASAGQATAGLEAALAQANAQVDATSRERTNLDDGPGDSPADGMLARDIRQLDEERKRQTTLEDQASAEEASAAAEVAGVKASPGITGRPGNGSMAVWHRTDATRLRRDAEAASRRVDALTSEIKALRADQAAHRHVPSGDQMADLASRQAAAISTRTRAVADLAAFRDGQGAWIDRLARRDPAWVSVNDGLLGDLGALGRLLAGSWELAAFFFLLKAAIVLLETSCCISKVLFAAPGIYAVQRVAMIEAALAGAAGTIRRSRLDGEYMAAMGDTVRRRSEADGY